MLMRLALRSSTIAAVMSAAEVHPTARRDTDACVRVFTRHFLDLHKLGNKEAIEKERARISDELSRGYFADIAEMRKNGGKIAMAHKTIIPSIAAVKFPDLEVSFSDGRITKLPVSSGDGAKRASNSEESASDLSVPQATLVCLSFRASSQAMAESWSNPFLHAFGDLKEIQVYEVSLVDSWLLSLGPIKRLFLQIMKSSNNPQKKIVYSFGDHYDLRKKLQILNLLTGYIFLLDRMGRIRWQGFGSASDDELSALISCTSLLLDEK